MKSKKDKKEQPVLSENLLDADHKKRVSNQVMEKALELFKSEASERDYENQIFDILASSFKGIKK